MGQALSLPPQKLVERAGVGADVVAGQHVGMQQVGQGVHQLQPYTVAAFDGHPHAHPHIGAAIGVSQNVAGGAHVLTVILGYCKLGHAAAACIIVVVQLRPVDERQTHIKIGIDKIGFASANPFTELKNRLSCFRDFIAYRIVIAMPRCHLKCEGDREKEELKYLSEIANVLPGFLEERGFTAEPANGVKESTSSLLNEDVRPYYRDYICGTEPDEYQSLHITFYDNSSRSYMEVQLRTKTMDDIAEIGPANHLGYEKKQESERVRRDAIPKGECIYFDEAYERGMKLLGLELSELDVNMFSAVNNSLINDGCGLSRGRLILPYEHLSRFQNDLID